MTNSNNFDGITWKYILHSEMGRSQDIKQEKFTSVSYLDMGDYVETIGRISWWLCVT